MPIEHPTAGRLGHLTDAQQEALLQLQRELVAENKFRPTHHDEHLLLRFLRARKFNVPLAKTMLLNCEAWREKDKVEELARTFQFPEGDQIRALYPQYYHKIDKLGRPIYIEHLGNIDIKKITTITSMERMQQKLIFEYERSLDFRFPACSLKAGQHIEQSCTIIDLAGVSLMSFSQVASFVKQIAQIGQDYYPEQLGTMFIINAPMLFSSVWSLIKPFLDEVTVKKIHILGSSYKKSLLEYIDEDSLPERLGGKCKCPQGCDVMDLGPWTTVDPALIAKEKEDALKRNTALVEKLQAELKVNGTAAASS
ncbi:CRAL-TRIO domain-containing protein [Catenaria anguillulae PL171]|uniref:CRAL-TRIO domain-containing protein n=1 Tax=Catenaria anguillulae PL171 TaxID=765915 RepID=A0A1Y2H6A6_9FUNG|nr:CRAL-TRIO domain-containing protein [Catenaria anguillulae PL171]ORZ30090.1 CRAL-TRIO domain-containing protein [Catenaria anguillulae PL171]